MLDGAIGSQAIELFSVSPALFVENQGQWEDESVRFLHQGDGVNVAMTDGGPVFQLFRRQRTEDADTGQDSLDPFDRLDDLMEPIDVTTEMAQFSARFVGANLVQPLGLDRAETRFNYFIGDQENRHGDVPGYEAVAYQGLYDGIDLKSWGKRSHLKYEFHVAPGADYRRIQVSYEGIDGLWLDDAGALHVETALGDLVDDAPYVYQEINGQQVEVVSHFRVIDADTYSFSVTGDYDPSAELIIDPNLAWSSYLGGSNSDSGIGVAVDDSGNVWVSGSTESPGWGSAGFHANYGGGTDAYVAKLSSNGQLLWSTYIGGIDDESARGIAVDADGNAWVAGWTYSSGWASGGFDTTHNGGRDGFLAMIGGAGQLVWSSYLGGSSNDDAHGIAIDHGGFGWLSGNTYSVDWASNGFDTTHNGSCDGFVARVSADGQLIWSSYVGGRSYDTCWNLAMDSISGRAFVTGTTYSTWLWNSKTSYAGSGDAYVVAISAGGQFLWSTYLGGADHDTGFGITVDHSGNVWSTGLTGSSGWVVGGFDTSYNGGEDAFLAKTSSSGQVLWSSYIGGSAREYGYGVAADGNGGAWVTGKTRSSGWVSGGFDTIHGGSNDAYVAGFGTDGQMNWSSYLGGSAGDVGVGIALDSVGNAWVTGNTDSADWISGGFDSGFNGRGDAFVAKISELQLPDLAIAPADISFTPSGEDEEIAAMVRNAGIMPVENVPVLFRDLNADALLGFEVIPSIDAYGSAEVSVSWTPDTTSTRVEVTVDPFNEIDEASNRNNTAVAVYDDPGQPPTIEEITAQWDADGNPARFGRFVSGVTLWNTFSATVVDADGGSNVDHVDFTLGSLGTVTDSYAVDGWSAEFDMGRLSGDATLTVTAYDGDENASAAWTGTVHVVPFPTWLGTPGADDYFAAGHYHLNRFLMGIDLSHTVDPDWWIIGGATSEFRLGLEMGIVAGLGTDLDVALDYNYVLGLKILNGVIFDYGNNPFIFKRLGNVSLSLTPSFDGDDLSLTGLAGNLTVAGLSPLPGGKYSVPEASYTLWVYGVPVRVALGMNVGLELNAQLQLGWDMIERTIQVLGGTYLEPKVWAEPYIFGGLGVDYLNIGLEAGGELGLHYRIEYDTVNGSQDFSWGSFQINVRAVATVGKRHTLITWTIPNDGPWTFGNVPPRVMMATLDENGGLDVLPWPNVAADTAGNVLLTRVLDADLAAERVDPEIACAFRDSGGTWSALSPVAGNDLLESDPDAAFDGQGGAVVSWVANTIDPALVESTAWDVYLETQEIHSSYWDGNSWSVPQVVTSDGQMDGGPEVALEDGQGLMLWERAAGTGSIDLDGFEICYALWDDTTHTWGPAVRLTDDDQGDWAPTVALGATGEGMAVWVHDADGDPTTAELYWAPWDGVLGNWSAPAAVPIGSTEGVREPRIAYASNGDVLLAWVGNEGGADILYTSIWDHVARSWSTPEAVPETPGMIEGLDLDVSAADEAMLVWHGWDGQNDLFSTARNLGTSDPWAPPIRITDNPDGEWIASTAFDSDGKAVTVWANDNATTVFGEGADGIELRPAPNLAAEGIEVLAMAHIEGQEARLAVDVANVGLAASAESTVMFSYCDPDATCMPIGDPVTVPALAPGESAYLVSEVFILPPWTNDYHADVASLPEETITEDNSVYVTIESAPPDETGPQVSVDVPENGMLPVGTSILTLSLDEPVVRLTEMHVSLVEETWGIRPPDHVYLGAGGVSATLIFEGGLAAGNYTLKVLDSVTDLARNVLDGDGDGSPGGDYLQLFEVDRAVVGRHVFYNNSAFDDPSRGLTDEDAVAPDPDGAADPRLGKTALLPGQTASFRNYTSYDKGINGIIVDIVGLADPDQLNTENDFWFRVGNSDDPGEWLPAPGPSSLTVGEGPSATDRVIITWDDDAIRNQWLQVTVRATDNTGLAADDVFCFGNAVGEAGDSDENAIVNTTDEILLRSHIHGPRNPAAIDDPYDFNRDRLVNVTDRIIARNNRTGAGSAVQLITAPPAPGGHGSPLVANAHADLSTLATTPDIDVAAAFARDAVLERAAQRETRRPATPLGKLAWLFDFEQTGTRFACRFP